MVSNILCGYSNYSVDKWGYGWAVSFITELPSSISGTFTNVNTQDINITGNAATATKLATARTINGTSFDGSANITTANWGTARNISISDSDLTMNFDNIYTKMNPQIIENIEPKDMAKIKENEKLFEELK